MVRMADQRLPGLVAPVTAIGPGELPLFPCPQGIDPGLQDFLDGASQLLCQWLGDSHLHGPRPGLSLQPSAEPGQGGKEAAALLADLQQLMAGGFRPNHPGALAHLDPPPLSVSIAADLIAAGMNNNLLAEELSPSLSRLERGLCAWLAQTLGLGAEASGVPASGGSLSNLMALVCARRAAGLQGRSDAVVITGAASHVSLEKALGVMGLPPESLWRLPLDPQGRLQAEAVAAALGRCRQRGVPVIAVVATAGSTVQGLVDPLQELAAVCGTEGVWLHVDGAIGAVCGLVDSQRWRVRGIGAADSVTLNPQKLLGVSKPSSLLLLRNPQHLQDSFGTGLPYMEPAHAGAHGGELGLQGTRGAEVLKLWLSLQHLGLEGIATLLEGAFQRAEGLRQRLAPLPVALLPGDLHLVSFAHQGPDQGWRDGCHRRLLQGGFWLSKPDLAGQPLLKAVLGNPFTTDQHLDQLAALVQQSCMGKTK